MNSNVTKYYIIYTKKLAIALQKLGHAIVKVGINPNKPEFNCYFFEDTKEFQFDLKKLTGRS